MSLMNIKVNKEAMSKTLKKRRDRISNDKMLAYCDADRVVLLCIHDKVERAKWEQ